MMLGRLRSEGHRVEAGPDQPTPLGTTPRQGPLGDHIDTHDGGDTSPRTMPAEIGAQERDASTLRCRRGRGRRGSLSEPRRPLPSVSVQSAVGAVSVAVGATVDEASGVADVLFVLRGRRVRVLRLRGAKSEGRRRFSSLVVQPARSASRNAASV